jgi:hypothetical protein
MKQVLQYALTSEVTVEEVPAPQLREWVAFTHSVQGQIEAPIRFEDLVCQTLATFRVDESLATGKRLTVDAAGFLEAVQKTFSVTSSLNISPSK